MAASMRIVSHIRCASEACKASGRHGRGIGVAIHLKRCSNEGIHGVLTSKLTENTVRPQAAIPASEEDVGASTDVFIHSDFASERVNALNPSALDSRNQRGVRIQRKVLADFSPKPERLSIGGEKKFNGSRVETNSVIE
jgi:hypothetical protein